MSHVCSFVLPRICTKGRPWIYSLKVHLHLADDWWVLSDHLLGTSCPHDHGCLCPSQGALPLFICFWHLAVNWNILLIWSPPVLCGNHQHWLRCLQDGQSSMVPISLLVSSNSNGNSCFTLTETSQVFPCHLQLLFLRRDSDGTVWRCHQQGLCPTKPPTSCKTFFPGGFSPISGSLPPVDLFLTLYPWLRLVRSFPREEVLPPPGEVMNEFRIRWCPSLCSNRIPACF